MQPINRKVVPLSQHSINWKRLACLIGVDIVLLSVSSFEDAASSYTETLESETTCKVLPKGVMPFNLESHIKSNA